MHWISSVCNPVPPSIEPFSAICHWRELQIFSKTICFCLHRLELEAVSKPYAASDHLKRDKLARNIRTLSFSNSICKTHFTSKSQLLLIVIMATLIIVIASDLYHLGICKCTHVVSQRFFDDQDSILEMMELNSCCLPQQE